MDRDRDSSASRSLRWHEKMDVPSIIKGLFLPSDQPFQSKPETTVLVVEQQTCNIQRCDLC